MHSPNIYPYNVFAFNSIGLLLVDCSSKSYCPNVLSILHWLLGFWTNFNLLSVSKWFPSIRNPFNTLIKWVGSPLGDFSSHLTLTLRGNTVRKELINAKNAERKLVIDVEFIWIGICVSAFGFEWRMVRIAVMSAGRWWWCGHAQWFKTATEAKNHLFEIPGYLWVFQSKLFCCCLLFRLGWKWGKRFKQGFNDDGWFPMRF